MKKDERKKVVAKPRPVASRPAWQDVTFNQLRLVTKDLLLVGFHEIPFFGAIFPRLYVGMIISPAGDRREVLIRDAAEAGSLALAFDSKLCWHSPLFWSANPAIKKSVENLMAHSHRIYGWCFLDDGEWDYPRWPSLNGLSPWAPTPIVEGFRSRLRALEARVAGGLDEVPTFGDLRELLYSIR